MSTSTVSELGIIKDFEIIWVDKYTQHPKDMNNVTLEIYHYEDSEPGTIVLPVFEPYIFTETVNDVLNIGSLCPASGYFVDEEITLELGLIATQLEGLGCPPNNYVVPGTTEKVALVDGYTKYALSACELAALINLEASGYYAESSGGVVIMKGDLKGIDCFLQVGYGSSNCVTGLIPGEQYYGDNIKQVIDLPEKSMYWIETGTYVCTNIKLEDPPYKIGERYFALYRGTDPSTGVREVSQEDFTVIKNLSGNGITYSFIK